MRTYLSPEEVQQIIAVAENLQERLILRLLWATGIRVSELVALTADSIDPHKDVLTIRHLKSQEGRYRQVPVLAAVAAELREYIKTTGIKGRVFPYHRQWIYDVVKQVAERAGFSGRCILNPDTNRRHFVSPHKLRDALGVAWLKKRGDMQGQKTAQVMLGHKNFNTTARYFKLGMTEVQEMYQTVFGDEGKPEHTPSG